MIKDIVLSPEEWEAAKQLADDRMKASGGHIFVHTLKTRCLNCGRSPRQNGRCAHWFAGFIYQLDIVMLNIQQELRDR